MVLIASTDTPRNAWQYVFEVHIWAENKGKGSELMQAEAKKILVFPSLTWKLYSSRVICLWSLAKISKESLLENFNAKENNDQFSWTSDEETV